MARSRVVEKALSAIGLMSLFAFGCDSDDDGQGKAGSGGSAATGAAAGLGGVSGSAGGGAGGASGRAGDGSGGVAAGGSGAASGGGSGGSAASTAGGQAGGGAGGSECNGGAAGDGSGGACNGKFTCSLESLCCVENCGAPTSYFDADGCSRSSCRSDDNCRDGRTCVIQPPVSEELSGFLVPQIWDQGPFFPPWERSKA